MPIGTALFSGKRLRFTETCRVVLGETVERIEKKGELVVDRNRRANHKKNCPHLQGGVLDSIWGVLGLGEKDFS